MLPEPKSLSHQLTDAESTAESVLLLHAMFYSVDVIASRLHLSQSDVEHVIQTGVLPAKQLELAWQPVTSAIGGETNG